MTKKIVLIGAGNVGCSFLYSAINQRIADSYILIDFFSELAKGQAMDLEDSIGITSDSNVEIRHGTYDDCSDADVIVITAGRPQKDGETRLSMLKDNAAIIKDIAANIKKTKFNGVTIIASNPVDVLTNIYQTATNFDVHKIFGTGTTLDTSRFKVFVGKELGVNPSNVHMCIMGEHGDSSVATIEYGSIYNKPIKNVIAEKKITKERLEEIHKDVIERAYEIIKRKKSTYYGIGVCIAKLVSHVFRDSKSINCISAYLSGQYGQEGLYIGVPTIITKNGWQRIIEVPLSQSEKMKFDKSCEILKQTLKDLNQ